MTIATAYRECEHCETRIILARGVPPLNYEPDPEGTVAARQEASGTWRARFLGKQEEPVFPEKRFSVHECEGQKRDGQRGQWTSHQRPREGTGRRRRPAPAAQILPGMTRLNPGRQP